MQNDPVVIASVARTPMGAMQGELKLSGVLGRLMQPFIRL